VLWRNITNIFPLVIYSFVSKKKLGCSHTIFALRQCAEYFICRGSSMFMAALDAKKAFDRLIRAKLFYQMYVAAIIVCLIKFLINW